MSATVPHQVAVIVNPVAGRGRAKRLIEPMRAAFATHDAGTRVNVYVSQRPGHERELANAALASGCDTIVAVGGDGTITHVVNAILHAGGTARLVPVAAGTGNDFVRNARCAHTTPRAAADAAFGDQERRIDVGQVEDTYFVNACGFGFDVAVLDAMARKPWIPLPGRLRYVVRALGQLRRYHGFSAAVGDSPRFNHLLIVFANGARFGGTFTIAPRAIMTDGKLDLIEMWHTRSLMRRVKLLTTAMRGQTVKTHEARSTQTAAARITFAQPPICQTDGERLQLHGSNVIVRAIPAALTIAERPRTS